MKVCVFGLWHLGSVTSACLARLGQPVVGLDFDAKVINDLNQGRAPLHEPGLNELILENVNAGRLSFTTDAASALKGADFVWVAFDTPVDEDDCADIGFLEKNMKKIVKYCKTGSKVIISSQAPVGFTAKMEKLFSRLGPGKKIYFASSPENLRLGKAIQVFCEPDRIVVGTRTHADIKEFAPLFSLISDKIEWMSTESAEMTKHAINAFLAASVSFANEIALLCERVGADAKEVERGLKTEARIGPKAYLGAGTAFSGGTLARDIGFLTELSRKYLLPSHLIKAVKVSNDFHRHWVKNKCAEVLGSLKNKKLAILGLTYKPGTDTLRRSFAVALARSLKAEGALIRGFDPMVKAAGFGAAKIITLSGSVKEAINDAKVIIVATQWPEFTKLSPDVVTAMEGKIIIDPNGFIEPLVKGKKIKYFRVGSCRQIRSAGQ